MKANVAEAEAEIRDAKDEIREAKAKVTEAEAKVTEAEAKTKENPTNEYWINELKERREALKTANETLKRREEFFFALRKSFFGSAGICFHT